MSEFLERISHFSPKRLALLADDLNDRVQALEAARREPVAIVGIGCRLPGGIDSAPAYWQLLRDGTDAITEVPPERWPVEAFYDPDPDKPGRMSTRYGGFVGPVDGFDAAFFGISPREAQHMDPQQRLLLEVTWRALEDAGIAPPTLEGSRTGVFIGLSAGDYYQLLRSAGGHAGFDAYTASGTAHSIASGRLAYTLGLRGPALSIDTACSSSLVAIHQAVTSLRRGECELALAGGVNLILGPDITIALSRAHMMAPDGRCKAFDARADGFVRGEGCAMLVLKPLSKAQADGDRVWAVIRGSAINQDGRSNGLTAPNGPAQEAVLREALADAELQPADVGYVEAHGTGTSLGDPIEVQALHAALGAGREAGGRLLVGSVKAAIGHLEAAAGVAGLVKAVLVLRHGQVPAQLHLQQPNPYIPWDRLAVEVPRVLTDWPRGDAPRRAGISSFGFSGTNVHVLLEEAPPPADRPAPASDRPLHLYAVSARSEAALTQRVEADAKALRLAEAAWPDLAASANGGRAHFAHRVAVLAANASEAAERLTAGMSGGAAAEGGAFRGQAGLRPPRVALLFTGQGSQHASMARALYAAHPGFREDIDRCAEVVDPLLPRPLREVLHGPAGDAAIDDTAFTQPALFAVEWALARLWLAWGVKPQALLGHSIGEIVAACVAGVFEVEHALRLVAARARLMAALPRDGAMASLSASPERLAPLLARQAGAVDIAAVNGPANTVVSGRADALDALLAEAAAQGVPATRLQVSHAFHSPLMEPMLADFRAAIADIPMRPPVIEVLSNISGRRAGAEIATADYWVQHVRAAVQFAPAVGSLIDLGIDTFIEVGPHPVLLGLGAGCVQAERPLRWLPSLRRGRDDWTTLLSSVAQLYAAGAAIDWAGFDAPWPRRHVALPGYPFQRERFWIDGPNPAAFPARPVTAPVTATASEAAGGMHVDADSANVHPLLGREVAHPFGDDRLFESWLHVSRQPWLADHRIQGSLVLPSPVCMAIAVAAAQRAFGEGPVTVEDLTVHRALPVDGAEPEQVQAVLSPAGEGRASLRLLTREADDLAPQEASSRDATRKARFEPLATARLGAATDASTSAAPALDLPGVLARTSEVIAVADYYAMLQRLGLEFGPRFRGALEIRRCEGEVLATLQLPEGLHEHEAGPAFHPALLDACFHVVGAALPGAGATLAEAFLLMNVQRITVSAPLPRRLLAHVQVDPADRTDLATRETFRADLHLHAEDGQPLLSLQGIAFKRARPGALRPSRLPERVQQMLHEVVWREMPLAESATPGRLAAALEPSLEGIADQHGFDRYGEFLPGLDRLASAYVRQGLRALGAPLAAGDRLDDSSRAALGVLDRHQRLFERMLEIGGEDGWLRREGHHWRVTEAAADADPEALGATLAAAHPEAAAELVLTQRCARELAAVLRGGVDPLALLFPGGSLADTERLYRDSPPARAYNGLIASVVERLAAAWPAAADRPLRVLEIGAGTGSTTAYAAPRLAEALAGRAMQYTFTDVSPLFLHRARERFAALPGMRYQLLDIGLPPGAQGFEASSFDIVIGANVLHATADLQVTLDHVQSLLAPGGTLVLLEGVLPQRFGDLTVGLLDGWWAYTDTQRRSYALMSRSAWLDLFSERGFAESTALPGDTAHPVWKQQAVFIARRAAAPAQRTRANARWLIRPDQRGTASALAEALRARGDVVDWLEGTGASLAASLAAAFKAGADGTGGTAAAAVLDLAALDLTADAAQDTATLMADQERVLGGTLSLVQGLALAAHPLPLWIVTRGAQAASASEGAVPGQATLWGLSHVVALEHPELACRRVDLDPADDAATAAAALLSELDAAGGEDQIVRRAGDRRLVRRLHRAPRRAGGGAPVALHADRTYLVTGGLHGLGLRVARWLVQRGARHLVLAGRRAPDATALQEIEHLRQAGAETQAVQLDVADEAAVAALLQRLRVADAPLAGIVHSAGALDDGVLATLSWDRFASVMAAKVRGSWNLHRHAGPLDFLVLFSSGASVGGSPGQANHAAANAFEDALAWHRNAAGSPTLSINWGPWAEIGAAADRQLRQPGSLQPIAPADGLLALEHLLRLDDSARFVPPQVAVLATDWAHLRPAREAGREPSLYRDLVLPPPAAPASAGALTTRPDTPPGTARPTAAEPSWRERLLAAQANRRRTVLRDLVRGLAAKVLGLGRAEDLAPEEPLRQLGLDSLMAVELRNLLSAAVGQTLPATVTFDHPSVAALVDHLARTAFTQELGGAAGPETGPAALRPTATERPASAPPAPAVANLDDLDADALAEQLMNRLDQIDPIGHGEPS